MSFCRRFLIIIFVILSLSFTGCSHSIPGTNFIPKLKSGRDITVFVATDIHYLADSLTDNGEAFKQYVASGDGKQQNYIHEITDAFVRDIKAKKPDILILSGDLTNNGEKDSHKELSNKLKTIESFGTAVYVIPGNHDIENPWARQFKGDSQYKTDTVSAEDFSKIYGDFGYNEAASRDTASLSYLAGPSQDLWLLMLDTNEYENNEALGFPMPNGAIKPETFKWIKNCSELAKQHHAQIITVMHQNLLKHVDMLTEGYTLDNSQDAIKVFEDCNLNLVLSGHIHIQNIKSDTSFKNPINEIVTSALSVYPQQYGILKFSPSNGFDYTTARVDVEGFAKDSGIADKNIINFKEYSKNFFMDHSYGASYNRLLQDGSYTESEIESMSKTMAMINVNLFSGTELISRDDILKSQGFKLWKASKASFSQKYIMTLASDKAADNTKLHISLQSSAK